MNIKKIISDNVLNKKAFTLIEIIVSIAIIGIIAASFISIFSSQYISIVNWGNKSKATYKARGEVERKISDIDTLNNDEINITFGEGIDKINIKVPIGLVTQEETVGKSNTTLKTGLPLVPIIKLDPVIINEGKSKYIIHVKSMNLDLQKIESITLKDNKGDKYDISYSSINQETKSSEIKLMIEDKTKNLENNKGPYTLEIKENGSKKKAKTSLYVDLPQFVAINNNKVLVSSDGEEWIEKNIGSSEKLKEVNYSSSGYLIVGEENIILIDKDKEIKKIRNEKKLKNIIWSGKDYFGVSENGRGISKLTGESIEGGEWKGIIELGEQDNPIKKIKPQEDTELIVIQEKGIVSRTSGDELEKLVSITIDLEINDAIYGKVNGEEKLVFVGSGGKILVPKDNTNKEYHAIKIEGIEYNLNSIAWNEDIGKFIIVGESNTILISEDLEIWGEIKLNLPSAWVSILGI